MPRTATLNVSLRLRRRRRFLRRLSAGVLLHGGERALLAPLFQVALLLVVGWSALTVVGPYLLDPPVTRLAVAGATAGPFTPAGGRFQLAVIPRDPRGGVAWERVSLDQFSFRGVTARSLGQADGAARPVRAVPSALRRVPGARLHAVLIIDNSGSMEENDPGGLRFAAARGFLDHLGEGDRVALMHFLGGSVRLAQPLSGDLEAVRARLDAWRGSLVPDGGTPLHQSVVDATTRFSSELDVRRVIVLLTDGDSQGESTTPAQAVQAVLANEATLLPVGLGAAVEEVALQRLARQTGGSFLRATDATGLADAFRRLALSAREGHVLVEARGHVEASASAEGGALLREGVARVTGALVLRNGGRELATPFELRASVRAYPGG